ncbi:hypothetical protein F511_47573 [Dorcoceras hygrometricum]|uniref:Uncharacterized protein n=1 Tax=Dorcoceras hygrometricum TaxID=472368 RepID=A0A2Z6ZQQ9_9LAMI|nr:hypothetical protein F511_47573 [Dorcoceras hygrometricum]
MSARDLSAGRASMTGRALRRTRVEAAHGATFAGPPLRITVPIARAGRTLAVRPPHEKRPSVGLLAETLCDMEAPLRAVVRPLLLR